MSQELVIANISILQDEHGRYNLNTLHRASEKALDRKREPNRWYRLKTVTELVNALKNNHEPDQAHDPIEVVHGGDRAGIYAHEILAIEYAGWISPDFRIKVNQAFIDSKRGRDKPQLRNPSNQMLVEAIYRIDEVEAKALQAEEKADQAIRGQTWITIRQYVAIHSLTHQLPPGTQQQHYGKWLTGYCSDKGLPVYKQQSVEGWNENTYPVWAIQETVHMWLTGQIRQLTLGKKNGRKQR